MPEGVRSRAPVESAVLVPVFRDEAGELRVLLVVRGEHGIHGGQVALPGGTRHAQDADLLATALREAEEEVGLDPAGVEVLAELESVDTTTGFLVTPYLARVIRPPEAWRIQEREIAEVLVTPVADLVRDDLRGEELWHFERLGMDRRVRFIRVGAHKLWGATLRILEPLAPRLLRGEFGV